MMKTRQFSHQVVGLTVGSESPVAPPSRRCDHGRDAHATGLLGRSLMAMCLLALSVAAVRATAPEEPPEKSETLADKEMKPTEIGVRFTPGMAKAIGIAMTKQMKQRYDLDDGQVEGIQEVISHKVMRLVQDNAKTGRDMFEFMLETAIANGGGFPAEEATEFAKMAKPIMPALREFFKTSAGEIGKQMTIKQRLKLTGDMAAATAGLVVFENRMKRWEEGKVGDFANPFYDSNDNASPDAEDEPVDPNESPEHKRARQRVESYLDYQINVDNRWDRYVDHAILYYDFDESQEASARAILKDSKSRAKVIKTPQFRRAIKENRILQRMAYGVASEKDSRLKGFNQGPWMYHLNRSYEKLMKPLNDLEGELKLRIDGLPTSQQRANAKGAVGKAFAEKGVKQLPI